MLTRAFPLGALLSGATVLLSMPANPVLAQRPDLAEAVATALRANPDILLARLRVDSSRAERTIAGAIPAFTASSIPQVPWQYTLSAPLDIGPQRWLRTHAAARGVVATEADAADVRRDVVFAVRTAFVDVLLAESLRALAVEERDLLQQVLAADSARQRAGDVPARDVVRAEVEFSRADAAATRAATQLHQARLALQLLMGRANPDTAFTIRGDLEFRPVTLPDSLLTLAYAARPDVRAADARIEASRSLGTLAAAALVPTPVATLVHQDGAAFQNGSTYALGLGLQLPLLYWNQGERERSRAGLEAAQVAARQARARVATDVAAALDGYRQARALAERYDGLVTRAAEGLAASRYAYDAGAASFLDLIDAIRTYAAVRADDVTARHDYWVAVYAVSHASGVEVRP